MVFLSDCKSQLPTTSARDTQQHSTIFFNSMGLFKNNEVMPLLRGPDTDVMNISLFFPLCWNDPHFSAGHKGGSSVDSFQDAHGSHIKKSFPVLPFFSLCVFFFVFFSSGPERVNRL